MKNILIALFVIFLSTGHLFSQYYINDQGRVDACSGTIELGAYPAGDNYTITICSDDPENTHISITFEALANAGCHIDGADDLCIHDGIGSSAPVINCNAFNTGSGAGANDVLVLATQGNSSGCLTLVFSSTTAASTMIGQIHCVFSCPSNLSVFDGTSPTAEGQYTSACYDNNTNLSEEITFNAHGSYGTNGYSASDGTSIFHWDFGDGTQEDVLGGISVTHQFPSRQGYHVKLVIEDSRGCESQNSFIRRVRISREPVWTQNDFSISPAVICQGQNTNFCAGATGTQWFSIPEVIFAEETYLPDGIGVPYTTSLRYDAFNDDQVLESLDDFCGICVNMEHSYLGDLTMSITCPNNTTVELEAQGGGGTYLGHPLDGGSYDNDPINDPSVNLPGTGEEYCWTPDATNGTLEDEAGASGVTLTPGNYSSEESLSGLIGCPLNGLWTITVVDHLSIDNGYIFSWHMCFENSLYPNVWSYQSEYVGDGWTGGVGGEIDPQHTLCSSGTYTGTGAVSSQQPLTAHIKDDYGCPFDTTVYVTVLADSASVCCEAPEPTITESQTICGTEFTLNVINGLSASDNVGYWEFVTGDGTPVLATPNETSCDISINSLNYGHYTFKWTEINNNSSSCTVEKQLTITFAEPPVPFAGADDVVCGNSYYLGGSASNPTDNVSWVYADGMDSNVNFSNETNDSTDVTVSVYGRHEFLFIEDNGTCSDTDKVTILFNQVPLPTAQADNTCGNSQTLNGSSLGADNWEAHWTGPLGTQFIPADTCVTPEAIVPPSANGEQNFCWVVSNGECIDSACTTVIFTPPPFTSAAEDVFACDTFVVIEGVINGGGDPTGYWFTYDTQIGYLNGNTSQRDTITINPNTVDYGDSSIYRSTMIWNLRQENCEAQAPMTATFYEKPKADAGKDDAICGLAYQMDADFSINYSTGKWTCLYGIDSEGDTIYSGYNFQNDTVNTSNITVTQYGTYTFTWKEKNAWSNACGSVDTVVIDFVNIPTISAGDDKFIMVCGEFASLAAHASGPNGTWNDDDVTFRNPIDSTRLDIEQMNPEALVYHQLGGGNETVTMVWQEYYFSNVGDKLTQCIASDTVTVAFFKDVQAIEYVSDDVLSGDSTVCGKVFTDLNAQPISEGVGNWIDMPGVGVQGNAVFSPAPSAVNAGMTVEYYGIHNIFWVVQNGSDGDGNPVCSDSAGFTLRFIEVPQSNAGANYWPEYNGLNSHIKTDTACLSDFKNFYLLNPVESNAATTGHWYHNYSQNIYLADGTIAKDTITTDIFNSDDGQPDYFEFIWTEDNGIDEPPYSHNCVDRDTLHLTIARTPTGDISTRDPYCWNSNALVWSNATDLGKPTSFEWGVTQSGGSIDPIASTNSRDTIAVNWGDNEYDETDTNKVITLYATNDYGCTSLPSFDTIHQPRRIYAEYSVRNATCGNGNGEIIRLPRSENDESFIWNDEDYVAFGDTISNLYEGDYNATLNYVSLWHPIPKQTCNEPFTVHISDTGHVQAMFTAAGEDGTLEHLVAPAATVYFDNSGTVNGYKYEWNFGDGTTASGSNQSHVYSCTDAQVNKNGVCEYYPFMTATSRDTCVDVYYLDVPIIIERGSILEIPNVFSPDGDAFNQYFQVNGRTLKSFKGTIVSRWGKTLYEWEDFEDVTKGWDGTINGGADAVPGVYFYVIEAEGYDGKIYNSVEGEGLENCPKCKGTLHLMRGNN